MAYCFGCERTDIKCCPTCARNPYTCNVWHRCEEDCEGYEPRIKTNADRIRSMSDEELAEFLVDHHRHPCKYCISCWTETESVGGCREELMRWLKSTVEE